MLTLKTSLFKCRLWSFKGRALSSSSLPRKSPYPQVTSASPIQRYNPNRGLTAGNPEVSTGDRVAAPEGPTGLATLAPSSASGASAALAPSSLGKGLGAVSTSVDGDATITASSSERTSIVGGAPPASLPPCPPARGAHPHTPREPRRLTNLPELQSQ